MRDRKRQHIELTDKSQTAMSTLLSVNLDYEPLLSAHPRFEDYPEQLGKTFLGKKIKAPLWVSSMTGGTELSRTINERLARACARFGIGMGLGSCRSLLDKNTRKSDFDFRHVIGDELPFYANLGIAQLEHCVLKEDLGPIDSMLDSLAVDGLIIHINPLQEFSQDEGDCFSLAPLETLQRLYKLGFQYPVIVKEVGQGMGPRSLKALFELPIQAIEFGAYGGTNFSKLEQLRSHKHLQNTFEELSFIGHTACQMVNHTNRLMQDDKPKKEVEFIISGGVRSFLQGYELMSSLKASSVVGMGKPFLDAAMISQEELDRFLENYIKGLQMAQAFCFFREDKTNK